MDLQPNTFSALTHWFETDLGQAVIAAERAQLDEMVGNYFGYHALQIAGAPQLLESQASPINHRVWLTPNNAQHPRFTTLHADCARLPFRDDTLDLILLPHVLEFIEAPQHLWDEIQRVLIPEGRLVVFGFNPTSLWGITHLVRRKKAIPWSGHFRSITHIRYWAKQQHLLEEALNTFFFTPPLQSAKRRHQSRFLEALGRMCWPWLGGLYMMTLRKQVSTLTPLRFKQKKLNFAATKKIATQPVRQIKHE